MNRQRFKALHRAAPTPEVTEPKQDSKRIPGHAQFSLRRKLLAMAERGVNGERSAAVEKLDRLEKRYDFAAAEAEVQNLFAGNFQKSSTALLCIEFDRADMETGSLIQWAIEHGCGIGGVWRTGPTGNQQLWVETDPACLRSLSEIAATIKASFTELWKRFQAAGRPATDRKHFQLGLYDGMLSDRWDTSTPLPTAQVKVKRHRRTEKARIQTGIALHPYAVGVELGRQIRMRAPIAEVGAILERKIAGVIEN